MIEHVYERAQRAEGLAGVVVLTDDERVAEAVEGFGGTVEMTPADCASGTDRIAWAARNWRAQAVVNIQGDEPMIEPEAIARVARHLAAHPDDAMVTLAAPASDEDLANPNAVKVVTGLDGRALYFSRAPIPFRRDGAVGAARARRHIGIYGYQRETLLRLATLEPTPLERVESLEQLRALENGVEIRVLEIESGWPGVDTMDDLETVEALLVGLAGSPAPKADASEAAQGSRGSPSDPPGAPAERHQPEERIQAHRSRATEEPNRWQPSTSSSPAGWSRRWARASPRPPWAPSSNLAASRSPS